MPPQGVSLGFAASLTALSAVPWKQPSLLTATFEFEPRAAVAAAHHEENTEADAQECPGRGLGDGRDGENAGGLRECPGVALAGQAPDAAGFGEAARVGAR